MWLLCQNCAILLCLSAAEKTTASPLTCPVLTRFCPLQIFLFPKFNTLLRRMYFSISWKYKQEKGRFTIKHSHKMVLEGCLEDWKASMEQQDVAYSWTSGNYFEGVTCRYSNFVNAVCCWHQCCCLIATLSVALFIEKCFSIQKIGTCWQQFSHEIWIMLKGTID